MSNLAYDVLHQTSGRIRVRLCRLKGDRPFQDRLHALLKSRPGVNSVRITGECASLVICFNEQSFSPEDCLSGLTEEAVLNVEIPTGASTGGTLRGNPLYQLANFLETTPAIQLGLGIAAFASVFTLPSLFRRCLMVLSTVPIFARAIRRVYEERRFGVDFMDGASVLILAAEKAYLPAGIIVLLVSFGEFMRDYAARRSENLLDELLSLSHSSAWLVQGNRRKRVPVTRLVEGDLLVVYTGEKIPAEGVVLDGRATVIPSGAGSNALPLEITRHDAVEANGIIIDGKLYLRCSSPFNQHFPDRIAERERQRHLYRTAYQRLALKRAYNVVMPLMLLASGAFLLSRNLNQALTIICFDFVTGIRIALPTAILDYLYRSGRNGVLIKTGRALEELAKIDAVIFARSGVITAGESTVTEIIPLSEHVPERILAAAAAVEYRYHHPAARAIYRYAKQNGIAFPERKNSQLYAGSGVSAELETQLVSVGSRKFMSRQAVVVNEVALSAASYVKARGDSFVYVAFDGELAGLIAYRDTIRPEADEALKQLKRLSISDLVISSGDEGESIKEIADLGVRLYSPLSPEEKAELVRSIQKEGKRVALVGDDVSDALAMAQADLAVAMSDSTDIAKFRADLIITDDDLNRLPASVALARRAMAHLRQNMIFVSLPNWLGLMLSITNRIGPLPGAVLNNGSVVLAAVNDLRSTFVAGAEKTKDLQPERI